MSRKRPRSPSPQETAVNVEIFRSQSIEDRASKFIAAYSPSLPSKQLQSLPEFKSASHRILAWRTPSVQQSLSQKQIYACGHDDDGEQYAGKKLEHLLANLDIQGTVVVARWYGGILLGPVRFRHIEDCARGAVAAWREAEARTKRAKTDEAERQSLVKTLTDRDHSISVLRDMLAEKSGKPPQAKAGVLDYVKMDLSTLKRLEKARDGTIAWILKAIEDAEVKQAE